MTRPKMELGSPQPRPLPRGHLRLILIKLCLHPNIPTELRKFNTLRPRIWIPQGVLEWT
jgi:hypothetical protein